MDIPFHKPLYDRQDEEALSASLRTGKIVGDGEQTRRASDLLADLLGVKHVLLTTSCTHALELAMMTLGLKPGDEVIVPSFTFVSTTNCVLRTGARIVFADIVPDTLTIDPIEVERLITPATRAVIPVVYAGVSPEMDSLMAVVARHPIVIVEDAAQGIGASYRGRAAGTTGAIGCYSFHETKNFSTGEGGALSTSSDEYMTRAEIIREKGTNRKQFMQGLVDKYTWVDIGSSYLPPDLVGALLMSQLAKRQPILAAREAIHRRYIAELAPFADGERLTLPTIPKSVQSNYHIFYVLLRDEPARNRALAFFRSRGVGTTFHYLPLHISPVGKNFGARAGDLPVTESVSGRLLRLPIYPALAAEEQEHIIATMKEFLRS